LRQIEARAGITNECLYRRRRNYNRLLSVNRYLAGRSDGLAQRSAFAQLTIGSQIVTPTYSNLTKRVENLTTGGGQTTDNSASVGDTLRYTLSYTNSTGNALTNVQLLDVLPSYTSFINAANNGSYNTAQNQITWYIGAMSPGATASVSYQASVLGVPTSPYVINNTAAIRADNLSLMDSNQVNTTVTGVVKGARVAAVTGGDSFGPTALTSSIITLSALIIIYVAVEYQETLKRWKLKWKIAVIKIKEN